MAREQKLENRVPIPEKWTEGLQDDKQREREIPAAPPPPYKNEEAYQRGVSKSREEAQERHEQKSYEKGRYAAMTPRQRVEHWSGKVRVGIERLKPVAAAFTPKPRAAPRYARAPRQYARAPQVRYVNQYGQPIRAPRQRFRQPEQQRLGGIFGGGNSLGMNNGMFGGGKKKKEGRRGIFG